MKFSVKMVVNFEDIFPPNMTKAKRNELMRDYAFEKLTALMNTYHIPGEVTEVRKLQND